MFHAFILVCGMISSTEIDRSNCMFFADTWGPYETREICTTRAETMRQAVHENHELNAEILRGLRYPSNIFVLGNCQTPGIDA